MTHLTAGPITVISQDRHLRAPLGSATTPTTQLPASETQGWSGWERVPGNQATYLFFPNAASMLLIILSTVSTPIIKGMSTVNVNLVESPGMSAGSIKLGAWGWCLSGLNDFPYVPLHLLIEETDWLGINVQPGEKLVVLSNTSPKSSPTP